MPSTGQGSLWENSQLLRALMPLQWFYACCGVALPPILIQPPRKNSPKIFALLIWFLFSLYVTLLNILVSWMVCKSNEILEQVVQLYILDEVTKILTAVQTYDVVAVQLAMLWCIFCKRKTLREIHKIVAELERDICLFEKSLEDKSEEFQKSCYRFRRRLFSRCVVFLILHSFLLGYAKFPLVWYSLSNFGKLLILITFHLMHAKCSEYRIMMQLLDEIITALLFSLMNLKYEIARHQILGSCGAIKESKLHEKLRSHQFLVARYWYLIKLVESYFALPMLVLFLYNGINVVHSINWIYVRTFIHMHLDTKHPNRASYIILLFINIMWTCWLSQICIDKVGTGYQQMANILHSIKLPVNDLSLRHRLREYSLQLKHQKIQFSCWGFFDINMKYFGLMSLAILTYVFILLQFKMQEQTEKVKRL
ncbi:putative gustatory receptor 98b [Musca vetustissima]|uniref:putative gustatory receptor 98b n=1 Tax=Musca vetustissima TaxID=27455 RepID=UPI002AB7B3BF|nr:putative gustatory receptor 98b [Musca vetustissima]